MELTQVNEHLVAHGLNAVSYNDSDGFYELDNGQRLVSYKRIERFELIHGVDFSESPQFVKYLKLGGNKFILFNPSN